MGAYRMNRQRVAEVLNEIALYLALKGESPFKIRAYENGARIIQTLDEELETLIQENRLGTVEGIGAEDNRAGSDRGFGVS
jgi:DNA polymerase (family 10)